MEYEIEICYLQRLSDTLRDEAESAEDSGWQKEICYLERDGALRPV